MRNAFNSARWKNICLLLDKLDVPIYLKNMIKSYFENRLFVYDTEGGPKEYQITGGVLQGSVLGSPLWNIMYDNLLKIQLPSGAEMVVFVDDVGLIITGTDMEEIWRFFGDCYENVQRWMGSVELELDHQKTEAVLFTSRMKVETISLDVGNAPPPLSLILGIWE